jgi:hypothetical protein
MTLKTGTYNVKDKVTVPYLMGYLVDEDGKGSEQPTAS